MWVDISYIDPMGIRVMNFFLSVVILINDFWNVLRNQNRLNIDQKKSFNKTIDSTIELGEKNKCYTRVKVGGTVSMYSMYWFISPVLTCFLPTWGPHMRGSPIQEHRSMWECLVLKDNLSTSLYQALPLYLFIWVVYIWTPIYLNHL